MNATDPTATPDTPPTTPDLVVTLQRCADALSSRLGQDDVPVAQLSRLARAHMQAVVFLQTAAQQPIGAVGDDFVGAAAWLGGYYDAAAGDLEGQATSTLIVFGADGGAPQQQPNPTAVANVVTALRDTASMWRDIASAAATPAQPQITIGEPAPDAAPDASQPSVAGIMRIWTAVASSLASTITSGQVRDRREIGVMTSIMVQTCREAAIMAAMLGG